MNYSVRKKRSWIKIVVLVILALLLTGLASTAVAVRQRYVSNLRPLDDSGAKIQKTIVIESGTTALQVAQKLEGEGIIRAAWAFEWYLRANELRDKIQAGTYSLSASQSISEIADMVTEGRVASELLRILPGKRLDQIRQVFMDMGYRRDEVDEAFNPANYAGHPALVDKPAESSLEGYIYPDSYQITAATSAKTVVQRALDELQEKLTPELRAGFAKQGITVHQAIIFASIVEQEVSNVADKPRVAQVFLTRHKIGMPLGSDPTAFYASAIEGKPEIRSVAYDSPYNTRVYGGLPPGPIGTAGVTALQAVADPATSDFLYFVAGDDGTTHFSRTLAEHEALTRQYCTKLCGR